MVADERSEEHVDGFGCRLRRLEVALTDETFVYWMYTRPWDLQAISRKGYVSKAICRVPEPRERQNPRLFA